MKILLTGATGFIGSAIANRALAEGHQVGGLIVPGEPVPGRLRAHEGLRWFCGTLQDPPWGGIQEFSPDCLVHSAWITTPGVYLESAENLALRDTSINFCRRLAEMGIGHIIGLGTCIEYKITPEPLSETETPIEPLSLYARCKNEVRIALEAEAARLGFGFAWARVFYPYGPGEHPARLCSSLIQKLGRGEHIVLKTPESQKDYIYIDDLASAFLTLIHRRASGPFNLGTGVAVSVRQMAETVADLLGKKDLIRVAPNPEPDPYPKVVAKVTRLQQLGWSAGVTLQSGLKHLVSNLCKC